MYYPSIIMNVYQFLSILNFINYKFLEEISVTSKHQITESGGFLYLITPINFYEYLNEHFKAIFPPISGLFPFHHSDHPPKAFANQARQKKIANNKTRTAD